jgi:hypothetical protein
MKKFAIATFAVLYPILVLSVSAERSSDWAAREAAALAQPCSGQHSPGFSMLDKSEKYLSQTRLLEPEFVVELPREAVAVPTPSGPYTLPSSFEYYATWSSPPFSSRAPPPQI